MRIAICGIYGECSTFSLDVMTADMFEVLRGDELMQHYDWDGRLGATVADVDWVPLTRAHTGAGGQLDPSFYDEVFTTVAAELRETGPVDGVYLDMHGALKVLGRGRAEERFVGMVREIVGDGAVLSMSMDPHGNFSEELASLVDVVAVYRHAPHIDRLETRDRAVTNLVEVIRRGARPRKAWVRVPVLLPGERTSTVFEPATGIFGSLVPTMDEFGLMDLGLWCGFPWADEDRNAAAVLALGDDEESLVAAAARIAQSYWSARADFGITSPHFGTWDEGVDFALGDRSRPTYLSDAGDNVTAGGSGDITWALARTLDRADVSASGLRFLFAGIVDEPSLRAAEAVGVGGVLDRAIGAVVDRRYADAVAGCWSVEELIEGVYGEGIVGAVLRDGAISVSVQSHRQRFVGGVDPATPAFAMLGLAFTSVEPYDVVVVKNGYLFPNQREMSGSEFMTFTPGGTDLDFSRLVFQHVERPMFPMDDDFEPDLRPRILPDRGPVVGPRRATAR
ncbi:MAG: M81 family metallopeptidase [Actinobacteria bacterium]|nr:M81 family metallopeptidase [Actinomycetota bacterium]